MQTWIRLLQASVVLAGLVFSAGSLSARVFTDKKGNTYDGSVANMTDDQITLMVPSKGKFYKIAITDLSPDDQAYIKSLRNKSKPDIQRISKKSKSVRKPQQPTQLPQKKRSAHPELHQTSELKAKYRLTDNYLTKWPTLVSIPKTVHVRVVSQDKAKKRYVYHSPSYEFICDVALSTTIIGEFGLMFETTREYCRLLPISSMKAHVPKGQKRHRILLFENEGDYVKNGGHPRAAGVYIPSKDIILVPLISVGVKKLSGEYNYDYNSSNKVLVHEIVHQLTDGEYFSAGARGWFSEGLAEYCAQTPYRRGDFSVRGVEREVKNYVVGTSTRAGLGAKINAPDLERFMLQSYSSFTANGAYNYRLGTLLTYYFFHMEKDRRNIIAFLKALKKGETSQRALQYLLNGRSFDQLERDITNAWSASGIEVHFQ